jgi:DNA-binding XRE family transcriptional regulator
VSLPTFGHHARGDATPEVRRVGAASARGEGALPQERLGELTGLHRNYVGAIEREERTPTITTADKLAQAFGLTLAGLFAKLDRKSDENSRR